MRFTNLESRIWHQKPSRGIYSQFAIRNSQFARSRAGFTLIELIIASGIFAMVLLLGFGVLADVGRTSERTQAQRRISQTTRYVINKIGREIRLANGLLTVTAEGQIRQLATPFIFGPGPVDSQGRTVTSSITINQTDFLTPYLADTPVIQRVILVSDGADRYLELQDCLETPCSQVTKRSRLTPTGVDVELFELIGVQHTVENPNRVPVVTIRLTLAETTLAAQTETRVREAVVTTVTTRNLLERLP